MNQEMELLIQAIEGLKQEGSIFKDYMFPLVSGFFSALLGAGVAYFTLKYQDYIQIEKEKMMTINRWSLLAEEAFSSLIAFKANYNGKLNTHPFQRVSQVPTILNCSKPIIEDFSSLSFIAPKKDDKDSLKIKWRGIPRIRAMINNYNFALEL